MALAVGRCFQLLPCSSSPSSAFLGKNTDKSWVTYLPNRKGYGRHYSRAVVQAQQRPTWLPGLDPPPYLDGRKGYGRHYSRAVVQAQQRPTWLPGLDPPPYLDGSLAGDFGFDPLGLGEDPASLKWYVQAELVHARFAMAGVAGILVTDLFRVTRLIDLPVWYEAGATKFPFASTRTLFIVQLILMGFVETKRYMDFTNPGSQARDGDFFGIEAALEGLEPGYPGGPLLNPLGLAKDIKNAHEWKLKEIKNGRLAMVAMLGFFVQAQLTHVGPIDNLVYHLSDPWHRTIIQTIAGSGP